MAIANQHRHRVLVIIRKSEIAMVPLMLRCRLRFCCSRRPFTASTTTPSPTTTTLDDLLLPPSTLHDIHDDAGDDAADDDSSDGWSFIGDTPGPSTLEPRLVPVPVVVPVPVLVLVPMLVMPAPVRGPAPPVHVPAQPEPADPVWIPTKGMRFHAIPCCGRMDAARARKVSRSIAEAEGFRPCKNCH